MDKNILIFDTLLAITEWIECYIIELLSCCLLVVIMRKEPQGPPKQMYLQVKDLLFCSGLIDLLFRSKFMSQIVKFGNIFTFSYGCHCNYLVIDFFRLCLCI